MMRRWFVLVASGLLAAPLQAGLLDDLKEGASGVRDPIRDVKGTKDEGKGVVAQGKLGPDGAFHATEVLAKHDENYMPPEAKDAIDQAHRQSAMTLPSMQEKR